MTESGYSIDLIIEHAGTRIGIEVDGPWHFTGHSPNSRTLLKRRQLQSLGWHLVSVPYFEWDPLRNDHEKHAYLRALIRAQC